MQDIICNAFFWPLTSLLHLWLAWTLYFVKTGHVSIDVNSFFRPQFLVAGQSGRARVSQDGPRLLCLWALPEGENLGAAQRSCYDVSLPNVAFQKKQIYLKVVVTKGLSLLSKDEPKALESCVKNISVRRGLMIQSYFSLPLWFNF